MIEGSLIVFGVMLSYWLDLGFSFLEPSEISWRFPIAFQIILAIAIVCLIPGLPESPRWWASQQRSTKMTLLLTLVQARSQRPRR
jgi:MFS family permease